MITGNKGKQGSSANTEARFYLESPNPINARNNSCRTPGGLRSRGSNRQSSASDFFDVLRLETFGALDYLEFHQLIFLQRAKALFLDSAVVHEDIRAVFPGNKPKTFGIVKPLHLTLHLH